MSQLILKKLDDAFLMMDDLINTNKFLTGNFQHKNCMIITNQDDAIIYATDQDVDYIKGKEYQNWTEILELQNIGGKVHHLVGNLPKNISIVFDEKHENYYNRLNTMIFKIAEERGISRLLVDCLSAEIFYIFSALVIFEKIPEFWKQMLEVFEHGGIPSGWKGNFPEGQMIVYNHKS